MSATPPACKRCGGVLRDPQSLARGYGDTCYRKTRQAAGFGYAVLTLGNDKYSVVNPEGAMYDVDLRNPWKPTCTCLANPSQPCKHIRMIRDQINERRESNA